MWVVYCGYYVHAISLDSYKILLFARHFVCDNDWFPIQTSTLFISFEDIFRDKNCPMSLLESQTISVPNTAQRCYSEEVTDKSYFLIYNSTSFCQRLRPRKVQILSRGNLLPGQKYPMCYSGL